jgi:hypothetical protein
MFRCHVDFQKQLARGTHLAASRGITISRASASLTSSPRPGRVAGLGLFSLRSPARGFHTDRAPVQTEKGLFEKEGGLLLIIPVQVFRRDLMPGWVRWTLAQQAREHIASILLAAQSPAIDCRAFLSGE